MAKIYQPIPGVGTGRFSAQVAIRTRIYRGPDHLLIVHSTGYTEEYKRVFYRDIQSVEVRPSQRQVWIGVVSGILTGLIFLMMLLPGMSPTADIVILVFSLPFIAWFLANLALGSTCTCYVKTGVQNIDLPAPRRYNKVSKLIEFLRSEAAASAPVPSAQPAG